MFWLPLQPARNLVGSQKGQRAARKGPPQDTYAKAKKECQHDAEHEYPYSEAPEERPPVTQSGKDCPSAEYSSDQQGVDLSDSADSVSSQDATRPTVIRTCSGYLLPVSANGS